MSKFHVVSTILLAVACSGAVAEDATEHALAITNADAALQWGPCPHFIPEGCRIAVLHGDPAQPNSDIFFQVPGNFHIPKHWHTSAERMVLVSGVLRVTYDGQETVVLRPGSYAYGPAKLAHDAFCEQGEPCTLFIAFESPVDAVAVEGHPE